MIPQYRIFYSWQSDNTQAKEVLQYALDEVKNQLKKKGIAVQIEQGGGGCGFISIEDSVRIKIRRCDIFIGDVTPVGNVAMKGKLLPNANVMYEMGVATECMSANRILAVAMKGDWKEEDMPFDFNHYTMLQYDPEKGLPTLMGLIKKHISETNKISRRENNRFFSERVLNNNIASQKYLPDTFLENMMAKEKARMFVAPHKMYPHVYEQVNNLNFDYYNKTQIFKGQKSKFKLDVKKWAVQDKIIDIEKLRTIIAEIQKYLAEKVEKLKATGNEGWLASRRVERLVGNLEMMNKQVMVVTSDAGQGKTNFVCDLVHNILQTDNIPYIFTNAYELSAEQLAKSIAVEYNFIGDYSLEEVIVKAELYCHQHLQYIIIVIDGLNEHPKQGLFKSNLKRVLDAIKEHQHVKVLLTCRKQYYDGNYQAIQQTLGDGICELQLGKRHRSWEDSEDNEDKCLLERYAACFDAKEPQDLVIRSVLLNDLLLMRIFFQGYKGQDLSKTTQIDYVDLYGRYFSQLCGQIQTIIEQESHVTNVKGMAKRLFDKIIVWMIENNKFTNLPIDSILESLISEERQCFPAFMSANLLLKQDMPEDEERAYEVLNFTYEQIRDYLISRYMVDVVYSNDQDKFEKLLDNYTSENSNLAEGTKMFLFLYVRNYDKKDVYELIKLQPWHDTILVNFIWNIPDEKITEGETKKIKTYLSGHTDDIVRILVYSHWSPVKYKNLNLQTLFDVLEEMGKEKRTAYLESVWPSKPNRYSVYGRPIITPRGELLSAIRDGIARRNDKDDEERNMLEKFEKYLLEGENMNRLYIPRKKEEKRTSPYVLFEYETYRYLMRVHKGDKKDFLALAGVKKGFAKEMFSTIYDAIFAEAKDVKEMYDTYYKNEYKSFEHFLKMHYSIPSNVVKKYSRISKEKDYRLIDLDGLSYGGEIVSGLVLSDELMERMYKWLNWQNDEDKN